MFPDDSKEAEFKEKLLDSIQAILLQYNIVNANIAPTNYLLVENGLTVDKKLLLVISHILLSSFSKNKLCLDFSIVKNENEADVRNEENFDFASTQINKQKIIDLNKITFIYLRVS